MMLEEVLTKFKLNDSELLNSQGDVYWQKKLIALLLQDVYVFPNDANSTRTFNDCISNEDIQVFGKSLTPGKRGIIAYRGFKKVGEVVMNINPVVITSIDHVGYSTNEIVQLENILKPYIDKVYLEKKKDRIFQLIIRVFLTYLLDANYRTRVNNLCTHQNEHRIHRSNKDYVASQKSCIVQIFTEFLNSSEIGKLVLEKSLVQIKKKGWKFIETLVYVVLINCNSLFNSKNEEIGIGLDPDFSLINHSCVPNCLLTCVDDRFQVVNTVPILQNEEITVTYVDPCLPRDLRMLELNSRYFFKCKCELCSNQEDVFFGFCCPWCHKLLKSPTLTSLIRNIEHTPPQCPSCFKIIDLEKYQKNITVVRYFIVLILSFGREFLSFDNEEHMLFLTNQLNIQEKSDLNNIFHDLISLSNVFSINPTQYRQIYNLINQIIDDGIFPVYSFPINKIINAMDDVPEQGMLNIDTSFMRLNITLIKTFLVIIPSDLSHQILNTDQLYLEIVESILKSLILMESSSHRVNKRSIEFRDLCICGEFFAKQITDKSKEETLKEHLANVNKLHRIWQGTRKYEHVGYVYRSLLQLFEFANIPLVLAENSTKFKVYNAKRELITLFYIFDDSI